MHASSCWADLALILCTAVVSFVGELVLLFLIGFSSSLVLSACFLFDFFFSDSMAGFDGGGGCISWSESSISCFRWLGSSAGCIDWVESLAAGVLSSGVLSIGWMC